MKVIQLENVSKMYRLGEVGTGTISHDLARTWAKFRGKEDPFAKIGQVNNREESGGEYVWALKDINLEVEEGEILGIIGRNGAGKSTLLKLLSRVTAPTTGRIRARGRIASLLEVGTGFHPELTGRENVYLNGALLGMTRREITRRMEEIVEFSGCAKYIDTPVKRYSSGMTVRLGFAVAAHLECEILIVDEVLAVGDAEFQKKCMGKMKDVAAAGKTVLFVSHSMAAMQTLTNRCVSMKTGKLVDSGTPSDVIPRYLSQHAITPQTGTLNGRGRASRITNVRLLIDSREEDKQPYGYPSGVEVEFDTDGSPGMSIEAFLVDSGEFRIGIFSLHQFHQMTLPTKPGRYIVRFDLMPLFLASGIYHFDVSSSFVNNSWDHFVKTAVTFEIPLSRPGKTSWSFCHHDGFGAIALRPQTTPTISLVKT